MCGYHWIFILIYIFYLLLTSAPTPCPSVSFTAFDQRLSDHGDDPAPQRSGPTGFSREFRGHRCRSGALWLCLAGWAEAGQPTGGDLQSVGGLAVSRANDRPAAHLCDREGGHHSSAWRLHTTQVEETHSLEMQEGDGKWLFGQYWNYDDLVVVASSELKIDINKLYYLIRKYDIKCFTK